MIRRARLYLTRKYKRSVLLLLLMLTVSASILTGLCVSNSIHAVISEIKRTLGTSISFQLDRFITQDSSYGKSLKSKFWDFQLTYDGPDFNWDTVHQILEQLDGISDYNPGEDLHERKKDMEKEKEIKKLEKSFITETDDLKAYITCRCPACACGCQNINDSYSVQRATKSGYRGGMQEQSAFWNR